jgi:DNA repair exonuclease SbcCD ATPase subunit
LSAAQSKQTSSPLEQLHADRAGLTGELTGLQASSARLRETANAEAAVLREIGEMGSAEIAAMTAWASAGCAGEQPAPDLKQRRALAEKLAAAQSAAAAAKGAGQDIDAKIVSINGELADLSRVIEKAALDAMQADFGGLSAQHLAATEALRKISAKLYGLCSYLANEGRNRIDRGDHEAGKAYLARAEALNGIKLPNPGVTQGEIIEAANDWSRRAAALRSGS